MEEFFLQLEAPHKEFFMDFFELVSKARTCRRFREAEGLPAGTLDWLVDCARLAPNGGNAQVLRYAVVETREGCDAMFPSLKWAAYYQDWNGPEVGERPAGYIILLGEADKREKITLIDAGIAAQTIQLAAASRGVGCCIFLSFNASEVTNLLELPEGVVPLLVLALGKEKEVRCIDPMPADGSVKYWRDEQGVHHVPKRSLEDVRIRRK